MRARFTAPALLLACLLGLTAARPSSAPPLPTHAELVEKVKALEARVAALERAAPAAAVGKPGFAEEIKAGNIVIGMTEAQAGQALRASGGSYHHQRSSETPNGTRRVWEMNADPYDPAAAKTVTFENGVVVRVDR